MKRLLRLFAPLVIPLLLLGTPAEADQRIRVAFLNPLPSHQFWKEVSASMKAASHDLDMSLTDYASPHWPAESAAFLRALLNSPQRPDYLVISNMNGAAPALLQVAEDAKVPTLIVDAGLLDQDQQALGGPRQRFKYWIGQLLPNNVKGGADLANALVQQARQKGLMAEDGKIQMIALGGRAIDYAGAERPKGLRQAVLAHRDVELLQLVDTDWSAEQGAYKTQGLLGRYPEVKVIWAVNSRTAQGAIEGVKRRGLAPGTDVLVGGIDWTFQAQEAVRQGRQAVAVGGHSTVGGWAMVLLHDYDRGRDFARERLTWSIELATFTRETASLYPVTFTGKNWEQIDYRTYSTFYHPDMPRYDFSINTIYRHLH